MSDEGIVMLPNTVTPTVPTPSVPGIKDRLADQFAFKGLTAEKANLQKLFTLDAKQMAILAGLAITGVAAFSTTYNALAKVDELQDSCDKSCVELEKKVKTKFIVMLVFSILAVVVGLVLSWAFRGSNRLRLIGLALILGGILGIFYAISIRFKGGSTTTKLLTSWIAFFIFVLLAVFFGGR